jgi:hypothetical protein
VVAIGFRYSAKETWVACLVYAGGYLLLLVALGQVSGHVIDVVVRLTYVVIAAMLGNVISKVVLQQITAKVHVEEQLRFAAESRAHELGGRAALAVENARLYREAEEARARALAAQAEAQSERDHLRALFMQVPAIITISRGPQLVWELINPMAEKYLGSAR